MSNKISRVMIEAAAQRLASEAFKEKIKQVQEQCRSIGLDLYKQEVPEPVRNVAAEYREVYLCDVTLTFTTKIGSSFCDMIYVCYGGDICFPKLKAIELKSEDWRRLLKADEEKRRLQEEQRVYERKVRQTLTELRTEKNMREYFPEAMKYLSFKVPTSSVSDIDTLRKQLS